MNGDERAAAAEATAAAVAEINTTVADVSAVIRGNVRSGLRPLGPPAAAIMTTVDTHHSVVHRAVGLGARHAGSAAAMLLRHWTAPETPSVDDVPERRGAIGATRAAFGDRLPTALAPDITLIHETTDDRRLVVFVHGLGGHEDQWAAEYLTTVQAAGATPVLVRYNSGRSIAETSAELAAALAALTASWPAPVDQIVLVGHSMGGLIVTSALSHPTSTDWRPLVSDVVTLGSPFAGAPLERFARSVLGAAKHSRVAEPIVRLGDYRSIGIKDLGDGVTATVPANTRHHAFVGGLGPHERAVVTRLLGDGIVPVDSAKGTPAAHVIVRHLPSINHMDLMRHHSVTRLLASLPVAQSQQRPGTVAPRRGDPSGR